jgi:hypothetical protein
LLPVDAPVGSTAFARSHQLFDEWESGIVHVESKQPRDIIVAVSTKIDEFSARAGEHELPAPSLAFGSGLVHDHVERHVGYA